MSAVSACVCSGVVVRSVRHDSDCGRCRWHLLLIADLSEYHEPLMFGLAAIWLAIYGFIQVGSAYASGQAIAPEDGTSGSLVAVLSTAAILTYSNPHVYLDTMVLVGTVSLQFDCMAKLACGAGATTAILAFFFALG